MSYVIQLAGFDTECYVRFNGGNKKQFYQFNSCLYSIRGLSDQAKVPTIIGDEFDPESRGVWRR